MYPVDLRTERLRLREAEESDRAAVAAMLGDERQVRYTEFDGGEGSADALLGWALRTAREEPRAAYALALARIDDPYGALIGVASLVLRDGGSGALAGLILGRGAQGRGLAREAGRALFAFAFDALRLRRVTARCDPANRAVVYLLDRSGLRREAHHREAHWEKGRWHDRYVYALLAREWREGRESGSDIGLLAPQLLRPGSGAAPAGVARVKGDARLTIATPAPGPEQGSQGGVGAGRIGGGMRVASGETVRHPIL